MSLAKGPAMATSVCARAHESRKSRILSFFVDVVAVGSGRDACCETRLARLAPFGLKLASR